MILTCPSCEKRFQVPEGALGESGRKVKCSACAHVWFQAPFEPAAVEETPAIAEDSDHPSAIGPMAAAPCPTTPDGGIASRAAEPPPTRWWPQDVEEDFEELHEDESAEDTHAGDGDATDERDDDASTGAADDEVVMRWPSQDDLARQSMEQFDATSVVGRTWAQQREPERRGGLWALIVVLVLAVVIVLGLYQWRDLVMRTFPQSIPGYVATGLVGAPSSEDLKLEDVTFEVREEGADTVLHVAGRVVNSGQETRLLPGLRSELLDADGQVITFWVFAAEAPVLGPGETTTFQHIYRNPPIGGNETDLFVTFEDLR